jgi:hypothetical protein
MEEEIAEKVYYQLLFNGYEIDLAEYIRDLILEVK